MNLLAASAIPIILSFATYAVGKTSEYIQLIDKLNYELRLKSFKLSISNGLTISLDFWLDNPTDTTMKISYPLVILHYNGEFLAQNSVTDTKYTLKPKSQLIIPNITFKFGLLTVAQLLVTNILDITNAVTNGSFNQYITKLKQSLTYTANFEANGKPLVFKAVALGSVPSAIDRPITASPQYDYLFPLPKGKTEIVIDDADVIDTVRKMYEVVKQDHHLVKKATQKLFSNEKTVYQTSKKIFDWVFKHIKYNLERGEQLRNPAVTYHKGQRLARKFYKENGYYHKEHSADCDDMAILIGSFLTNSNIKFAFRITAYGGAFAHVYVIAFDEKGSPIIIDPVYHKFNAEKQYTKQITFDNNMNKLDGIPVSYLSGNTISADDAIKLFLQNSRNLIAHRSNNYHNAQLIVELYDYVLRYWDTDNRIKALSIVAKKEIEIINDINIAPRQYRNRCGGKMFFSELKDFASDNVSGLGAINGIFDFKDKVKNIIKNKLENLTNKNHTNNGNLPTSDKPEPIVGETPEDDDYTKESILKTGRDFMAKYKIPIAIGVFLTTSGIVVASSPKIQKQLKLRK